MDAKKNVRAKPSEKISGISVAISVTSLTLVMLLFMRIEFVHKNSKALETRLENRIQRIDDDLKAKLKRIVEKRLPLQETVQTRKSFESKEGSVSSGIHDHQRERRNVAAGTITLQQVRQEINSKLNEYCNVTNNICQTGPPGPPGAHGYPGYKGEKGAPGKIGPQGPLGPIGAPGASGKRGPVGPQGVKGDKGDKGSVGASGIRGETGSKGNPGQKGSIGLKGNKGSRGLVGIQGPKGECIVPPKISVYPISQEVFVNEPAIFYCWVQGHLSSKITWRKLGGTLSGATVEDGALRIKSVQRSHVGSYICTAHFGLGMFRIISRLQVKELPKFTNKPPEVIRGLGTNLRLCCAASGSPRPKVEWSRAQKSSALFPVSQEAGCLVVNTAKKNVEGEYICRATNSLGSAETATTVIATRSIGLGLSVILASNDNHLETLSSWLRSVEQSQSSRWKRCWRASVDGWAASTFHSLCDNKGPTVTIIRVGRYIFGGYTSSSWTSPTSCRSQYTSWAFLFSLVNKPGWGPVKLSQPARYTDRPATYSCSSVGPIFGGGNDLYIALFGGGYDIYISDYASSNTNSFTNLGSTYSPPSGHRKGNSFTKSFLAGSYKFQPDEVEVFYETT